MIDMSKEEDEEGYCPFLKHFEQLKIVGDRISNKNNYSDRGQAYNEKQGATMIKRIKKIIDFYFNEIGQDISCCVGL